jgi:class 3 adenylate cyclase/tetratricopeptide (TPR) repeat protein
MNCGECGEHNRSGRQFCRACGARLAQPCSDCSFENEPDERFCGGCGKNIGAGAAPPKLRPTADPSRRERRQVTVVFVDICGYTSLAQKLDPEETHALLQRFFDRVDGIIASFGGAVDKHIGDAVMGLFGAPVAHGNDPVRAVQAACEIQNAVGALTTPSGEPLAVHVGVANGEVIAGGLGAGTSDHYTVIGDSVNMASRLQERAAPGETLISDGVYAAVSGVMTCEPVSVEGDFGKRGQMTAWRLLTAGGCRRSVQRPPIVGREPELRLFTNALSTCADAGTSHVILVRGEAGIGKTRLVEEYVEIADANGFSVHGTQIFDFGVGRGQDAVRVLVRSLLGLTAETPDDERVAALEKAVADGLVPRDHEVFHYDLLDIPLPPRQRALYQAMDNATRNEGKQAAIAGLATRLSARQPLLLTIEDLQWAHEITQTYVAGLLQAVVDCPVTVVATTRPEGDPFGQGLLDTCRGVSLLTIDLAPLARRHAETLASQFVERLGKHASECIVRADGNPLFLQQLLNDVEERGQDVLPATIQSLILARMDRLSSSDRDALQGAAVLGQKFDGPTLRRLIERADYDCTELVKNRLLRPDGGGYIFAHSLIRDGAYSSLLRSRARELHVRAADIYRERDSLLYAQHLDKGGDARAAAAYLAAAEEHESDFHFLQAKGLIERALEIADDGKLRFDLSCRYGDILRMLGELEASKKAFEEAHELATSDRQRCRALIGTVAGMRDSACPDNARCLLDRAEALAARQGLDGELAEIHGHRGNIAFPSGAYETCLADHTKSLHHAKQAGSPALEARALSGLGDAEYARGRMRSAHGYFADCVALCRDHGFVRIQTANMALRGLTAFYNGDLEACLRDGAAAIQAAQDAVQPRDELVARTALAPALVEKLDGAGVREQCARAGDLIDRLGARRFAPECAIFLARILQAEGQRSEAERHAEEAVRASLEDRGGRAFTGAWALGTLAAVTTDPRTREKALAEGEAALAEGCVSHNALWFHRDAMSASAAGGDWASVRRHAEALETYVAAEPLGLAGFYVRLGRALADAATGDATGDASAHSRALDDLQRTARTKGYRIAERAIVAYSAQT